MKQIIAIGGGGFTAPNSNLKIEKYLIAQTNKSNPRICFLPQASNEAPDYIVKFFETFTKLGTTPSWVSLFGRVESTWKQHLLNQDIIYVGGGNTKSMMALWQCWELDEVLRQAYNKGIILSGISAGAICWFEEGITDSVWPLGTVKGLGLVKGSVCPHFDTEVERQSIYRAKVNEGAIPPGIALEDNTAAHYIDGNPHRFISSANKQIVTKIEQKGETIITPTVLD